MDKVILKDVLDSFAALEQRGLLPAFPVTDIYSSRNSVMVTVPYPDEVPVRSTIPHGWAATRDQLNREFSRR